MYPCFRQRYIQRGVDMKRIMTREEYEAAIGVSSEKKKIMTREEYEAAI